MVGDVLVRLFGQKLQQLHLNSHRVRLLLLVSVAELKLEFKPRLENNHPNSDFTQRARDFFTLLPPFMSAPNQTGLLALGLDLVHQALRGMFAGRAEMQVSPLSMLQKTLMASFVLP